MQPAGPRAVPPAANQARPFPVGAGRQTEGRMDIFILVIAAVIALGAAVGWYMARDDEPRPAPAPER